MTTVSNAETLPAQDAPAERLTDNVDAYQDSEVRKVITKRDLFKCALRGLFMEGNFNFERMQAGGYAYSMVPALKKIHGGNQRDFATALKNHLQFFNSSPKLFTFLLGLSVAMEENKEKPSTINAVKVAGLGPLGGIGDALDHMTLMPLTLALGAAISMDGSIAGPFVFFVLYQIPHFLAYFGLMFLGYNAGAKAMASMSGVTEKLARAANIMGLFVIGALTATFIKVQTTLELEMGGKAVPLQADLFDKIMPNLLPLALVFFMFKMVRGKGFFAKPPVLIFGTLAFGVVGHYLGIL
ncbi:TPA: PTS system mannose/fructose/sorbose family transporter subunit IID [Vibrio parahaemolyticus]